MKNIVLLLICFTGSAVLDARTLLAAPQAQKPGIAAQDRVVTPKDAINGADWLKAEGVPQGLDQLDLGADEKGKPIKFQISHDGTGVSLKLTGSALDSALAGDKVNGGIMGKLRKKNDPGHGSSGLTITDLFGSRFAPYDPQNDASQDAKSASRTLGKIAKLNELMGGGKDHYIEGSNLYPSDLRTIQQNAPVIKLLAENKWDDANKLYSSLHASDAGADLGTSDPTKLALIQNLNTTMDKLTAQEQLGAKTLHFKAEGGIILAHLDDRQTANIDKVLASMSPEALFETGRVTYRKDAGGKGVLDVDSGISSKEAEHAEGSLKIAIDNGDAKDVKAYQKYRGLTEANLPKR